jgi:hypothetical protein
VFISCEALHGRRSTIPCHPLQNSQTSCDPRFLNYGSELLGAEGLISYKRIVSQRHNMQVDKLYH